MTKKNEIPTIEIDMDKECGRCSEKGAAPNGLCLKCVTERLKRGPRHKAIHAEPMQKVKAEICAMFDEYHDEIDETFVNRDYDFRIPFFVRFFTKEGKVKIEAGFDFYSGLRHKHSVEVVIDEKQMKIPGV